VTQKKVERRKFGSRMLTDQSKISALDLHLAQKKNVVDMRFKVSFLNPPHPTGRSG
jgi:hypothetical protein